jgi:4-hydroxybenzoate polyprenyltransferase
MMPGKVWLAALAFAAFCLGTSSVYLINDIFDRESDRNHPIKSKRPLASGLLPVWAAAIASIALFIISIAIAAYINMLTLLALAAYLVLNLAYSVILKPHIGLASGLHYPAGAFPEFRQETPRTHASYGWRH